MQLARRIEITTDAVMIDGEPLPFYVGDTITLRHEGTGLIHVTLDVLVAAPVETFDGRAVHIVEEPES
jgi:hypothetical protein